MAWFILTITWVSNPLPAALALGTSEFLDHLLIHPATTGRNWTVQHQVREKKEPEKETESPQGEIKRRRFLGEILRRRGATVIYIDTNEAAACSMIRGAVGSVASVTAGKSSPCHQDDDSSHSHAGKPTGSSISDLPEDIWLHIHSLVPIRDAARAACTSQAFLRSWRCRPNLILNRDTLISKKHGYEVNASYIIDHILSKHSGIGVKILDVQLSGHAIYFLDSWLKNVVKPTTEELTVRPLDTSWTQGYRFPCSVLSDTGAANSLRYLKLGCIAFHPTTELSPLRNLATLSLHLVYVADDELECFLSKCHALEQLNVTLCLRINCLKIPCALQKLSCLTVYDCERLRVIESKAVNLSSLHFNGNVKLSLAGTLQMKTVSILRDPMALCYARSELPSIVPNLETLHIISRNEVGNTQILPTKFLHLKHLVVDISTDHFLPQSYDYISLVSFLDASPSLETLILNMTGGPVSKKGDSASERAIG